MAVKSLCQIAECNNPVLNVRGWCSMHYQRWRKHGDPLGGGTFHGEPERFLRDVVLAYDGKECLIWPFARANGEYASIHLDGRRQVVSRVVCQEVNGEQPTPDHEAAHSCGNGILGCVAQNHLSWKTPVENQFDRLGHGTHNRGERSGQAKITRDDVKNIRSLEGKMSHRLIASKFGISTGYVSHILTRRNWGWLE